MHRHLEDLVIIGEPPTSTREVEIHGAGVTGTHGIGVRTPNAAVVAEATTGLAIERHMPNGMMFTIGLLSRILPAGGPWAMTRLTGSTFRGEGVNPMLHLSIEPLTRGLDTLGR